MKKEKFYGLEFSEVKDDYPEFRHIFGPPPKRKP